MIADALAAYRLTRLINEDVITEPMRRWLAEHERWRALSFAECPHCVGMWMALGVILVAPALPRWRLLRDALATAGLVSLVADLRDAVRSARPELPPGGGPHRSALDDA